MKAVHIDTHLKNKGMYELNFEKTLIGVDGAESADKKTLSTVLSEVLATETKGNTVKIYGWYRSLLKSNKVTLDKADKDDLKKLIETNDRLFIYVKGQLLEIIDEAREKK
jgi:hypothetical protein